MRERGWNTHARQTMASGGGQRSWMRRGLRGIVHFWWNATPETYISYEMNNGLIWRKVLDRRFDDFKVLNSKEQVEAFVASRL